MTKIELATQRFSEGFHCSQAVLEAFAEDYDIDPVVARKIANPLAGGSALGGECGAVTGAFMVLGLEYGMKECTDSEAFATVFEKVGVFVDQFKACHCHLNCRELIGLDVFSEEGFSLFEEENIKMTQCLTYVVDAVKMVDEIIKQDSKV